MILGLDFFRFSSDPTNCGGKAASSERIPQMMKAKKGGRDCSTQSLINDSLLPDFLLFFSIFQT